MLRLEQAIPEGHSVSSAHPSSLAATLDLDTVDGAEVGDGQEGQQSPPSLKGKLRHRPEIPREPTPFSRKPRLFTLCLSRFVYFSFLFSLARMTVPRPRPAAPNYHLGTPLALGNAS